jgi:hypothetical protein
MAQSGPVKLSVFIDSVKKISLAPIFALAGRRPESGPKGIEIIGVKRVCFQRSNLRIRTWEPAETSCKLAEMRQN